LLLAVEVNCALGRGSVIDGVTFSRRADLERLDATLKPYRVRPLALFLDCPPEICRERVARDVATGRHLGGRSFAATRGRDHGALRSAAGEL
jgi:predicted kinase